jgi:hypothetical protein
MNARTQKDAKNDAKKVAPRQDRFDIPALMLMYVV